MTKNGLLAAAVALLALPALGGALMPRPAADAGAALDSVEVVAAALAWQGGYEPMAALAGADAEAIVKPPADPSTIARDHHRECGRCVRGLGDHLVGHALERVAEFCRHSECPVVREHCKHLKEHEDVLVGFLVARIRPFELSAFFCTGLGACGHEHGGRAALNATSSADLDAAGPALALASLMRLAGGSEEVRELVGGHWAGPVDLFGRDGDGDEDGGDGDSDGPERRCSACVHRVARHVMHGVVGGIIEMCHHTECPVIRAHCEWMHRHEGFVFGTLLERVEPAKFGVGACIANGSCEHGGGGGGGGGGEGDGDSDGGGGGGGEGDGDSDGGGDGDGGHHGHHGHHHHHHGHHHRHHGHHGHHHHRHHHHD